MAKEEPTIDEEIEEEAENSLRDDLEAAIEEEDSAEEEETTNETEGEEEATEEEPADESADEDSTAIGDAEGKPTPEGINAPIGMTPEAREHWKEVPDKVKEWMQAREKQIEEAVANTGEYRRTHTALTDLSSKYASILAAEGAETPMAAVEGLFKTVAELRVGSPQQVAQKMASLIGHYGVDIKMLDQALSGQPAATPEEKRLEQLLESKLAPFAGMFQQQQEQIQAQQSQAVSSVQQELAEFASKPEAEFLNDVREDMADLIELASKRGHIMSFEEAYKKACAANPEISSVLAQRSEAAELTSSRERANGKATASSAIPASSAAVSTGAGDESLRGTLTSVWDSYTE